MSRFHHGRDDIEPGAPERDAHAETDAPAAMVDRLLGAVFQTFYAGQDGRRWLQDQKPLLMVLTWPAAWLNQRGVGMPVAAYEAKMREIISTIATHGDLRKVKLIPAYFGDCVRKHFIHHGEALYMERKHVRNAMELALLKGTSSGPAKAPDAVESLAKVHAVLATARRASKPSKNDGLQSSLF